MPEHVEVELGWCAQEVAEELPGLRLLSSEVQLAGGRAVTMRSPPEIRSRLRELSNHYRGARAVSVRRAPVPGAYRAFFRQIGLDPDSVRTPLEAAVLERMLRGGFPSGGLLHDVRLIALVDTGVPVWALDAESAELPLGIRTSRADERLGRSSDASPLRAGQLVIADASSALAILFGALAAEHEPTAATRRLVLFAVQVAGVPTLYVEEALWSCRAALGVASIA
jgi:DNA/RNA-binding domain of Phe-tRNA-synthetase-like protein